MNAEERLADGEGTEGFLKKTFEWTADGKRQTRLAVLGRMVQAQEVETAQLSMPTD